MENKEQQKELNETIREQDMNDLEKSADLEEEQLEEGSSHEETIAPNE